MELEFERFLHVCSFFFVFFQFITVSLQSNDGAYVRKLEHEGSRLVIDLNDLRAFDPKLARR